MATPTHRESAQIIPFVPRARTTRIAAHGGAASTPVDTARAYPAVDFGGGWYHEAAMQDEARGQRQ